MKRVARAKPFGWEVAPRTFLVCGYTFASGSLVTVILLIVFMVYLMTPPTPPMSQANAEAVYAFDAFLGALALGSAFWGVRMFVVYRRLRQSEGVTPVAAEGLQLYWAPYRDFFSSRNESLTQVQWENGATEVFRIPPRWVNRVQRPSGHVGVTYNPQTGYVLDYRPLLSEGAGTDPA